jgi:hypothetical protein
MFLQDGYIILLEYRSDLGHPYEHRTDDKEQREHDEHYLDDKAIRPPERVIQHYADGKALHYRRDDAYRVDCALRYALVYHYPFYGDDNNIQQQDYDG